jgi:DNA mismatch repair protein MutL
VKSIRLLPAAVADAIAAGEVVERPASVVKELAENALDAGASRIDVDVEDGGVVRIRVGDDGEGIAADQLPLAVARHATSKIAAVGDLEAVVSLGFRGEALASIAAVAEVVITSRRRDAVAGAQLRVRGSQTLEHGPAAHAEGTAIEVRDLFATTPARLRFLRSHRSEGAACARAVADLALCRPEVAFSCRLDGRTVLRTPGGGLDDALRGVLGAEAAGRLIGIAGSGDVEVGGAISEPRAHRAARGGVVLVVNGRRIHNRALTVAVEEAYRGLLPGGRHPFGVVVVRIDPAEVDVNVHPAKREVRFREEGRVFAAVQRACWAAVQRGRPHSAAAHWDGLLGEGARPMAALALHDGPRVHGYGGRPAPWRTSAGTATPGDVAADPAAEPAAALAGGAAPPGGVAALAPLRSLGQVGTTWMVAESPLGVVLVDPHAAHEKVLYAELLAGWDAGAPAPRSAGGSQLLLLPVLVEVDATAMARHAEHAAAVEALGFAVDEFGPRTLRCTAVPAACSGADVGRLLLELLDTLDEPERGAAAERRHRVAALLACHSAVRFGDGLGPAEQQRLLDRLVETPGGTTCPHGRPTAVLLDDLALRRAFRRP